MSGGGRDEGVMNLDGKAGANGLSTLGLVSTELAVSRGLTPAAPEIEFRSCNCGTGREGRCLMTVHRGYELASFKTGSPSSVVVRNAVGKALVPRCRSMYSLRILLSIITETGA